MKTLVGFADELVDAGLVVDDVGFQVFEVEQLSALSLGKDEVKEEDQTKP